MSASPPTRDLRWTKTTYFFVFHLHLFGALVVLLTLSEALFFSVNGVDELPKVTFTFAAVMLPLTAFYDRLSSRDNENRAFAPIIIASAVVILGLDQLRYIGGASAAAFALMVAAPIAMTFQLSEFWNFANRYFSIQESKRAFPQLFAAASLGGVAAGFGTSKLVALVSVENLVYIWAVLNLLNLLYIRSIRRSIKAVPGKLSSSSTPRRKRNINTSLISRARQALFANPLVTGILGLSFLGNIVLFLSQYSYYNIFSAHYQDADQLAEFVALWFGISSALNFGLSIFVLPRISAILGVRNLTLVQPILAIISFAGLAFVSSEAASMLALTFGVSAYLLIQSRNVVEETNEKFLFKGLANDVAQVVRGRSEGAVKPIAAAVSALLLYLFGTDAVGLGSPTTVAIVALLCCTFYVGSALIARHAYPRAIVEMIRNRTFDPSETVEIVVEGSDSLKLLREQLKSDDTEVACFAAEHLHAVNPEQALELVVERLDDAPERLKADLLRLIANWDTHHYPRLRTTTAPLLHDPSQTVRAAAIRLWSTFPDADMSRVTTALSDDHPDVRREAVAALCTHWDLNHVANGAQVLHTLLNDLDDTEARLGAVTVLGRLADRRHLRMLTPLLGDDSNTVRVAAARTFRARVDASCDFLVDELVTHLAHRESTVRLHLLEALLKIGSGRASRALLEGADNQPISLRTRSARFLARQSPEVHKILTDALTEPGRSHGQRMLAAQALSLTGRRNRALLIDIAQAELVEAYQTILDRYHLEESVPEDDQILYHESLDLFFLALSDRRREALELVVEIVGFAAQHPEFDTIRSCCFSADAISRAYAIEALENLSERHLFELLLPFLTIDPEDEVELALGGHGERLGLARSRDDVLMRRLQDPHPWLRACALFTAFRMKRDELALRFSKNLTDDSDPLVRETARWVLGRLDPKLKLSHLILPKPPPETS